MPRCVQRVLKAAREREPASERRPPERDVEHALAVRPAAAQYACAIVSS